MKRLQPQLESFDFIRAHIELKRVVRGESIVDRYALQPSEFFPCAVEAFFQKPVELRDDHVAPFEVAHAAVRVA